MEQDMKNEGDDTRTPDTQQSAPNLALNAPQTIHDDVVSRVNIVTPATVGASGEGRPRPWGTSDSTESLSSSNAPQTTNDEDTAVSGDRHQSNSDLTSLPSTSSSAYNSAPPHEPRLMVDSQATQQPPAASPLNAPQAGEDDGTTVTSGPEYNHDDEENKNPGALTLSNAPTTGIAVVAPSPPQDREQQQQQKPTEPSNSKSVSGTVADMPPTRELTSYVDVNEIAPPLVHATPFQPSGAQNMPNVGTPASASASAAAARSSGMKTPYQDQSSQPSKELLQQDRLSPQHRSQRQLYPVASNSKAQSVDEDKNDLGKETKAAAKNGSPNLENRKPPPSAPLSCTMEAATTSSLNRDEHTPSMPNGGEQEITTDAANSVCGSYSVGTERTKKTSNRTTPPMSTSRVEGPRTAMSLSTLNDTKSSCSDRAIHCTKNVLILVLSVAVVVLAIGYARATGGVGNNGRDGNNGSNGLDGSTSGMLGLILERGVLRCGIPNEHPGFAIQDATTGEYKGMDVDLCRAVAAAIFGEDGHVELHPLDAYNRFAALQTKEVDMLARTTTHTMERDLSEATTGAGFTFSAPYLYNGLQFAGVPFYVECADNFDNTGTCAETKICANDGTTHIDEILASNPDVKIVSGVSVSKLYDNFVDGFCNVIAGEQFDIAESALRGLGYDGEYQYGSKIHSKEPLALVTREDDADWSDFVNWILIGLISAEDMGVVQQTANSIPSTEEFRRPFQNGIRNAVSIVGNYAELYERNLESILPRPIPDRINNGNSGLIYSLPFGFLGRVGPDPIAGGDLEAILLRGHLRCGVEQKKVFARKLENDDGSFTWSGFDVDFCSAISAALFDGETDSIDYVEVDAEDRFISLQTGQVDLLFGFATLSLAHDVKEPTSQTGFSFSQPHFYDGLSFGGIPPYIGCTESLDFGSSTCSNIKICVSQGTDYETQLKKLFPERSIVSVDGPSSMLGSGLADGSCQVIAGGVVDVAASTARELYPSGTYEVGTSLWSKDPLALVTRQDDPQWSQFVFWIVSALFFAEEQGISTQTTTTPSMPLVNLFGPSFSSMFRHAVEASGSYGEIYERNAQLVIPRGGLNQVNFLLGGPQLYPYPGIY